LGRKLNTEKRGRATGGKLPRLGKRILPRKGLGRKKEKKSGEGRGEGAKRRQQEKGLLLGRR